MSTDPVQVQPTDTQNAVTAPQAVPPEVNVGIPSQADTNLPGFVEALQAVDLGSPGAKANESSISDNNGGRITLVDDSKSPDALKK